MIGILIQAADARAAVADVVRAEQQGIPAAWATMFGAGGGDMIPVFAAAAGQTTRIRMGTSIVHTWGRHPVALAQESIALDQISGGRFVLGIGSTTKFYVERLYGREYTKPLTNLVEYLTTVRALITDGRADLEGEHVRTHARLGVTGSVPVMGAALGTRSFEVCGEVADGAISWMCPQRYLTGSALPALAAGAERAGRERPPLVAHVPFAVDATREEAHALANRHLRMYANVPNYQRMFAVAGYQVAGEFTPELLDDLVLWGDAARVAAGLRAWIDAGVDEVIAQPLLPEADNTLARDAAFEAVARASHRES